MQHYCSRNLTNTIDLLLFWLFWHILSNNMPTDLKISSRLLSCIRGIMPFQLDHGSVLLIRTTSRVTVSAKSTAQLKFSLLNLLCTELCVPSLYWEMTPTKVCCVDYKDGDHYNLQCRPCDDLMVSVTGEIVFIPSNLFESMDTSSVTGCEPSWYCLQKSEPNM